MQIQTWMKDRTTPGTEAHLARRILASARSYRETETNLRKMYVLEAVMKNGGSQKRAAEAIGVSGNTVNRILQSLGMTAADVRRAAKFLQERADAKS